MYALPAVLVPHDTSVTRRPVRGIAGLLVYETQGMVRTVFCFSLGVPCTGLFWATPQDSGRKQPCSCAQLQRSCAQACVAGFVQSNTLMSYPANTSIIAAFHQNSIILSGTERCSVVSSLHEKGQVLARHN